MTFTAHGKVILLGEHAVVYGVPAIAVGIHANCLLKAGLAIARRSDGMWIASTDAFHAIRRGGDL